MNIEILLEQPKDYYKVELLTREAFWGFMRPDCDEHYLAHKLRESPAFIPQLDFIAKIDNEIVGNIMYSKAKIIDSNNCEHEVLTFGPLSVLPKYQNSGIGSALMKRSMLEAKKMGYKAIVIFGHPDYYPRFGFCNAKVFDITTSDGDNFDSFMAIELFDGALCDVSGKFFEDAVFDIDNKDAEQFDNNFPHKDKVEMTSIELLLDKLPKLAQKSICERKIKTLASLTRFSGRELLCWEGIDENTLLIINEIMISNNLPPRLFPNCDILNNSKFGIKVIE